MTMAMRIISTIGIRLALTIFLPPPELIRMHLAGVARSE
jgi:hypothetical protein